MEGFHALGHEREARLPELIVRPRVRLAPRQGLRGRLVCQCDEREPVLIWQIGARRYLAASDGALFAELGEGTPPEAAGLPVIDDRRAA